MGKHVTIAHFYFLLYGATTTSNHICGHQKARSDSVVIGHSRDGYQSCAIWKDTYEIFAKTELREKYHTVLSCWLQFAINSIQALHESPVHSYI